METFKYICGGIAGKIGMAIAPEAFPILAAGCGLNYVISKDTLKGVESRAQNHQKKGMNREVAYTEAMHDCGVIDDREYQNIMNAIKNK